MLGMIRFLVSPKQREVIGWMNQQIVFGRCLARFSGKGFNFPLGGFGLAVVQEVFLIYPLQNPGV